ncbi:MAG: hypothetical protein NTU44_05345 [Bacteroidetes bacterium]|nr:hypothetical protein [Bacteroidota bacterium]
MLLTKRKISVIGIWIVFYSIFYLIIDNKAVAQPTNKHDLKYSTLPAVWDEGLPLGNGMLGAMLWEKNGKLRFSLDRADLWDLRTIPEFQLDEWNMSWVYQRWLQPKEYMQVQQLFDLPYERDPWPTRIPAGAFEFNCKAFGPVASAELILKNAFCRITWKKGVVLTAFINATSNAGFFEITGLKKEMAPEIVPHLFQFTPSPGRNDTLPAGLEKLNYPVPQLHKEPGKLILHQDFGSNLYYEIAVRWQFSKGNLTGVWTISGNYIGSDKPLPSAGEQAEEYLSQGFERNFKDHQLRWERFWKQSSVSIPDTLLERQWYRDMYKLGCSSGRGAPAMSLQTVWTSDDGGLPPWKNDFHNDLNTQMSYWPCYSSNHLAEAAVYTDWLWTYSPVAEKYTKRYFGADGLNFPGVCALNAYPLGGWIQYAFSATTSAWLAQHFYWQWKYSMDRKFLESRAYPWVKKVADFLDKISVFLPDSTRYLLMSSSPEFYDNTARAWFKRNTTYDISLIRNFYRSAGEMAGSLGLEEDKRKWERTMAQWPMLPTDTLTHKLLLAPGHPQPESHRHFSHLMPVYPLGLLDWRDPTDKKVIEASLADLKRLGTEGYCGYSYSWLALLQARAGNGEEAAKALRTFITCFCSSNSFHLNGDQTNSGASGHHERIFTLEGNMGYAAAIQEMLLQGFNGIIRVFPAVPAYWDSVSFTNLRTEGAFVISALKTNGEVRQILIIAEKGGKLKLENPFLTGQVFISGAKTYHLDNDIIEIDTSPGQVIRLQSE